MTNLNYLKGGMIDLTHVVRVLRITSTDGAKVIYVLIFNCTTGQVQYFTVSCVRDILISVVTFLFTSESSLGISTILVPGNAGNLKKLTRMNNFSGLRFLPSKVVIYEPGLLLTVTKVILPNAVLDMDLLSTAN